ncbi:VOC family protein [Crocinitomix algicola]|uniref:VOC family protein n=1 Tax=Crocinitomix algicola TaxID=1740263 RepID=UPI0008373DF0|nr:VOC family protein [Crocinitomix algicola]
MKLRIARHTQQLQPIIDFYTKIIGLSITGKFENHQGYDGVFLGLPNQQNAQNNWQLEFTVSWIQPHHYPDPDDLLVFYPKSQAEYALIVKKMQSANIKPVRPQNPYWKKHGITLLDPDGYGVVIVEPVE